MNDTDKIVLSLLDKVRQKREEIALVSKVSWETSCSFGFTPDNVNDRVNIQTVTDISKLVTFYGFLNEKENSYKLAAKELGVSEKFVWMGFSVEAWKKDLKTRVSKINIKAKQDELAALEKRVDSLVTQEQRRELELAELQRLLQ